MVTFTDACRLVRRTVLGRRHLLAAVCAALAVAAGLRSVAAPPPASVPVLTATRDLAAGTVLTARDLKEQGFAPGTEPSGPLPLGELVGRTTAGPVRAGEPVTDVRLVRGSLLAGYPGSVAVPVRIADEGAARLLRVGDRVDLLAADPQTAEATLVVSDATVIALPQDATAQDGATSGALVVLALSGAEARRAAGAQASAVVTLVLRG